MTRARSQGPAGAAPGTLGFETAFRPRVALLVDVADWAFGNIARQLVRHLSDRFDFAVIPVEWLGSFQRALLLCRDADLIHVFWREYLSRFDWPEFIEECRLLAGSAERFGSTAIGNRPLTTAVYDHLFLSPEEVARRADVFRRFVKGYTVSSARLHRLYGALPGFPAPSAQTPDGVDLELFSPGPARDGDGPMVVGWVGNSGWSEELYADHKGLRTIVAPAVEQLRAEGLDIRLELVDRARGLRPQATMPAFYRGLDVHVCASLHEGTPNPVLEAMACGVPVISTDVGIVPEAFGPLQRDLILRERSVDELAAALRRLHADRALRMRLRAENLESIRCWDWSLRVRPFAEFFHTMSRAA